MKKEEMFEKLREIAESIKNKKMSEFNKHENSLITDSVKYNIINDILYDCDDLTKMRIYYDLKEELGFDEE